mmetsp:Transcript_21745/g.37022  ORF Transcript_21745/g.37022 Transcript_21745/m.37022 type:complete len:94 (+) Transcript_21745:194-475(+)
MKSSLSSLVEWSSAPRLISGCRLLDTSLFLKEACDDSGVNVGVVKASADGVVATVKKMIMRTTAAYPPLGRSMFLVAAAKEVILLAAFDVSVD